METLARRVYLSIQRRFFKTAQDRIVEKWFKDRGDQTLRIDYPLNSSSIVLDVGGYQGAWAAEIFDRYGCTIHVFEPVRSYYLQIAKRFENNSKVIVHDCGLGAKTCTTEIHMADDGTSIFSNRGKGKKEVIKIKSITDFVNEHQISQIDLMKVNIEGAEYDLLQQAAKDNLIPKIKDIQIQFHNFFPEAPARRLELQEIFKKSHVVTYDYPFVWENWRRTREPGA